MKFNTTASKVRLAQSLATASGALAATAASTQAATVQITLTGNRLTSIANTLNADVTGDGINDLTITGGGINANAVGFAINGQAVAAQYLLASTSFHVDAQFAVGGVGVAEVFHWNPSNTKYLNPILFSDARINGGASTRGYLEVNAFNTSETNHTIALTRLVFNDASTTLSTSGLSTSTTYTTWTAVPEPSSFGLLALGAGGLLVRRRRQAV